jgi:hypothetical protein
VDSLGAVGAVELDPSGVFATDALVPAESLDVPVGSVDVDPAELVAGVGSVVAVGSLLGGAAVAPVGGDGG